MSKKFKGYNFRIKDFFTLSTLNHILKTGTSLAVQWLRLRTSKAGAVGSIPGRGTKISHAAWRGQNF